MAKLLGETQSLCPVCLCKISAMRVEDNGDIYLEKSCSDHGHFRTLVWRGSSEWYQKWGKFGEEMGSPKKRLTDSRLGCPYDCGLCPEHKAESCFVLMEVTHRCNLNCPVCFARANEKPATDPSLDIIEGMWETVSGSAGTTCPVQLSGGEPTIRDDLPEIIAKGKQMGFDHIQVNTNGIRIAEDVDYLYALKRAGASVIYLQFDGATETLYYRTRGRDLFDAKLRAIENCSQAKIGCILVPTLIRGFNTQHIGEIVKFAKSQIPVIKGIHFQPMSYFGRYSPPPKDEDRVTIPDVLLALEEQTEGEIKADNLVPRRRKESYCSFGGLFVLGEDDKLVPVTNVQHGRVAASGMGHLKEAPYEQARRFVRERWRFIEADASCPCAPPSSSWDSFFNRSKTHYLTITCMPFQDAWSVDLERLERCCTHVVTPEKRLVPFCSYYITDTEGSRLRHYKKDYTVL